MLLYMTYRYKRINVVNVKSCLTPYAVLKSTVLLCVALAPLEVQVQINVYDYMLELMNAKIAVYSFARLFTEVPTHTNTCKHQYVCAVS